MSFSLRESIHEGSGKATLKSFFQDRLELKIFLHNTVLRPGASIGFHKHQGSEEIYYIISRKVLCESMMKQAKWVLATVCSRRMEAHMD